MIYIQIQKIPLRPENSKIPNVPKVAGMWESFQDLQRKSASLLGGSSRWEHKTQITCIKLSNRRKKLSK